MIIEYSNEGQIIDKDYLSDKGFPINLETDLRKKYRGSKFTDIAREFDYILNFTGFLVNDSNDIFVVFPKKYCVSDLELDAVIMYKAISKFLQKRPDTFIGALSHDEFKSNYPFASFFDIYNFFKNYGLYFEDKFLCKEGIGEKISWKDTIRNSQKFLVNKKVNFYPFYNKKKIIFSTLLTECMIFSIDYTIGKFGTFLGLESTGRSISEYDFLSNKKYILECLYEIRLQTFKDHIISLVDSLIAFFQQIKVGGNYYFKHYRFSSIWETMVLKFLRENYIGLVNNEIKFGDRTRYINFEKQSFYPNANNPLDFISPDYYYEDGSTQLIFDAKYYDEVIGIDYKQISYYFFLRDVKSNEIEISRKFAHTHCALILPASRRETKIHFRMSPKYNEIFSDMIIMEEYLDIKEVMRYYVTSL